MNAQSAREQLDAWLREAGTPFWPDYAARLGWDPRGFVYCDSLAVAAITGGGALIGRLNIGAVPTSTIRWDQPHQGNLFDHRNARRAYELAQA